MCFNNNIPRVFAFVFPSLICNNNSSSICELVLQLSSLRYYYRTILYARIPVIICSRANVFQTCVFAATIILFPLFVYRHLRIYSYNIRVTKDSFSRLFFVKIDGLNKVDLHTAGKIHMRM